MLLSYRGSYYETITTQLPKQQDFTSAKYRGVSYKITNSTIAKNLHPTKLKYRGVTYVSSVKK